MQIHGLYTLTNEIYEDAMSSRIRSDRLIVDPSQIFIQVCMRYLKEEFRDDDVRTPMVFLRLAL